MDVCVSICPGLCRGSECVWICVCLSVLVFAEGLSMDGCMRVYLSWSLQRLHGNYEQPPQLVDFMKGCCVMKDANVSIK